MTWTSTVYPWSYDFDYLGHLTAAIYPKAFEQARVEFLRDRWQITAPAYVVASHRMKYVREVLEETSPVRILIQPTRIGRSSFDLAELLLDREGTVCNRSEATLVAWDIDARGSRPLTTAERDALARDLAFATHHTVRGSSPHPTGSEI